MNDVEQQTGFFLFSLDTELGWGYHDSDALRVRMLSPDGSRERKAVELLLDVLDEFGIVATWAITGHLFFEKCEECEVCPILEWKGKYPCFEEIYKTDGPLWYGADVVEALLARGTRHEIAFHGYTHRVFDEDVLNAEEARTEIQEWMRLSRRRGIVPQTVVFPRDEIGHPGLFKETGFICYRGKEYVPRRFRPLYLGELLKCVDYTLSLSSPRVYEPGEVGDGGMVVLPSSQHFFDYPRRVELFLDSLNLHNLRINRMTRGVRRAAKERKAIHIWAHPWEFRTAKDLQKLGHLFASVVDEMSRGRMQSIGMADLARRVMGQHREDQAVAPRGDRGGRGELR